MAVQIQATEKGLRDMFEDILANRASFSAIFVSYYNNGKEAKEIGVLYTLSKDIIEIGPYLKSMLILNRPEDYFERIKKIPLKDIIRYKRVELPNLL